LCGVARVARGSVLGPILLFLYTADLIRLIERHNLHPHLYADDTQICAVCGLMLLRSNRLQLNAARSEILWCSSARRQHQIPKVPLTVGLDSVMPVSHVRDLGIYVDADLSMRTHISKTASSCFGVLHQIRSIRRSVSRPTLVALVTSLVMARHDYGSAALAGLPRLLTDRLQAVLNGAALLINAARRSDGATPLLRSLHWFRAT
jgi:hypothetical protein